MGRRRKEPIVGDQKLRFQRKLKIFTGFLSYDKKINSLGIF